MDRTPQSNVLFVVLDTVRKDRLEPYGYERETTPELSRFAEEATVFESAVAPAPWTLPVHASLFTGRYPSQHGADQGSPYLDDETTLASTLSAAGYDTACYSSNAWITPYTGLTDGFGHQDSFFEVLPGDVLSGPLASAWQTVNDNDYLRDLASKLVHLGAMAHSKLASGEGADSKTPSVIDRTRSFIDDSESDDGWFAFVNLMDAHLPYYPPEEYREEFAPGVNPDDVCQNSKEFNSGARDIDDDEWEDIRGLYDAEIAHMDAELGRLFDWLRETGQWEETTVVVAADHGELHGEHDLYGHEFASTTSSSTSRCWSNIPTSRQTGATTSSSCSIAITRCSTCWMSIPMQSAGRMATVIPTALSPATRRARCSRASIARSKGLRIPTPASAPSSRERGTTTRSSSTPSRSSNCIT